MNDPAVFRPAAGYLVSGDLRGDNIDRLERRLRDMREFYRDTDGNPTADPSTLIYTVSTYAPRSGENSPELLLGVTHLMPGVVGGEYFMTKGHRHTRDDRPEYYWNIEGEGFLVLYDGTHAWVEKVERGSVHYVPGNVAHRLVNTGNRLMKTGACWPADAGHDYTSIAERGFPLRILKTNDGPNVRRNPAFHADS